MTTRSPDVLPSADRLVAAAEMLVPALKDGERITRRMMNAAMAEAYGFTSAEGVWSQRDSFQMVETAVMLALPQLELPRSPVEALDTLAALEDRLPTQTVRSEEQISHQHFSTPLGLAWLVAQFADLQPDDHVLEPSAGTGMLAIWARPTTRLHLNEIDPLRQSILRHLFPDASVTGFDAARIGAHLERRASGTACECGADEPAFCPQCGRTGGRCCCCPPFGCGARCPAAGRPRRRHPA